MPLSTRGRDSESSQGRGGHGSFTYTRDSKTATAWSLHLAVPTKAAAQCPCTWLLLQEQRNEAASATRMQTLQGVWAYFWLSYEVGGQGWCSAPCPELCYCSVPSVVLYKKGKKVKHACDKQFCP